MNQPIDASRQDARTGARLAYLTTAGFFAVLLGTMARPTAAAGAQEVLLGALGAGWVSVIGFYFGSSAGSRTKTALLARSPPDDEARPSVPR